MFSLLSKAIHSSSRLYLFHLAHCKYNTPAQSLYSFIMSMSLKDIRYQTTSLLDGMFDVEVICLIASFTKKDAFDKNWELGSFGLTFSHFASHDCILVFLHRIIIVSIPPIYTSYLSHEVWSTFSARLYQFDFLYNSTHVAIHDYVAPLIVEYTCSYYIVRLSCNNRVSSVLYSTLD